MIETASPQPEKKDPPPKERDPNQELKDLVLQKAQELEYSLDLAPNNETTVSPKEVAPLMNKLHIPGQQITQEELALLLTYANQQINKSNQPAEAPLVEQLDKKRIEGTQPEIGYKSVEHIPQKEWEKKYSEEWTITRKMIDENFLPKMPPEAQSECQEKNLSFFDFINQEAQKLSSLNDQGEIEKRAREIVVSWFPHEKKHDFSELSTMLVNKAIFYQYSDEPEFEEEESTVFYSGENHNHEHTAYYSSIIKKMEKDRKGLFIGQRLSYDLFKLVATGENEQSESEKYPLTETIAYNSCKDTFCFYPEELTTKLLLDAQQGEDEESKAQKLALFIKITRDGLDPGNHDIIPQDPSQRKDIDLDEVKLNNDRHYHYYSEIMGVERTKKNILQDISAVKSRLKENGVDIDESIFDNVKKVFKQYFLSNCGLKRYQSQLGELKLYQQEPQVLAGKIDKYLTSSLEFQSLAEELADISKLYKENLEKRKDSSPPLKKILTYTKNKISVATPSVRLKKWLAQPAQQEKLDKLHKYCTQDQDKADVLQFKALAENKNNQEQEKAGIDSLIVITRKTIKEDDGNIFRLSKTIGIKKDKLGNNHEVREQVSQQIKINQAMIDFVKRTATELDIVLTG